MEPTHRDIYNHLDSLEVRINQHDVRLARMEEKQNSIRDNVDSIMHRVNKLEETSISILTIAKNNEQISRLLLKLLIVSIPIIATLELWDRVV